MLRTRLLASSTPSRATASQITVCSAVSRESSPCTEATIVSVAFFTRNGAASARPAVRMLEIITIT